MFHSVNYLLSLIYLHRNSLVLILQYHLATDYNTSKETNNAACMCIIFGTQICMAVYTIQI